MKSNKKDNIVPNIITLKLELKEILNLYWEVYSLHANQRLRILHFFITIEIVMIGAFFSMYQSNMVNPIILCGGSIMIIFVSIICLLLDIRTTNLIHLTRIAIRKFEDIYEKELPIEMRLFTNIKASMTRPSFSTSVRISYGGIILIGFFLLSLSIKGLIS